MDVIRGRHQMAFGFNLVRVQNNTISGFEENGFFTFNGALTGTTASPGCANCGLQLADFLIGRPSDFQQTNATPDDLRQWIMSFYAQDTFKLSNKITLNFGVRWEPTFADPDKYGRGTSFSYPGFSAGQFSSVYPNAPAGLFFKGDKGIPAAMWNGHLPNFAPRLGVVWNPHGDGRDTLRVGGGILYDVSETWFNERETTNAPIGTLIDTPNPVGGFTNPWQGYPGGNPFPTNGRALFPTAGGTYVNMPLNPKATYVANWNVTYQRQINGWLASVSYLGNKTTHLWSGNGEGNPGLFLGLGACTINGINYSSCSTTSNTNQRRPLYLANPTLGAAYGSINTMDDGAVAHYEGLLISAQHNFAHHYLLYANYTDSTCVSDTDFGAALATPSNSQRFNRHADWGACIFDTRNNFNSSIVASSSVKSGNPWVSRLLSDWQLSPLIHAASGQPINIVVGKDNSLEGGSNVDRPNLVLTNTAATNPICNNGSTPCVQFLNPAAFSPNALGTYGNLGRNSVRGPANVTFDAAISRTFKLGERYSLQARMDAFNLFNHSNFVGAISPAGQISAYTTFSTGTNNGYMSSSQFGRIPSAFDPRILQFAMKLFF